MSRLFTFGCSHTQYLWPTWADIVAYDLQLEYYNYGMPGLGNVGIQHRILEADLRHKFQPDDIVLIMWSSWCREDRFIDFNWKATGSVLNKKNDFYDRRFVRKYWSYENDIVKNSSAIILTNKAYGENIKWQTFSFPPNISEYSPMKVREKERKLVNFYQSYFKDIDINEFFMDRSFRYVKDCHPDVRAHLEIVKNKIYPATGYTLSDATIKKFKTIHDQIQSSFNRKTSIAEATPVIMNVLQQHEDVSKIMNYQTYFE